MIVKQLYTSCLSESAYFIVSQNEAAIIDPLRDTESYIELAKQHDAKIKYIFETHFHADFVSGHLDLAKKTGATIIYGPNAQTAFEKHNAKDGEIFELGNVKIKAIHTPGHTLESTCYLLSDEKNNPYCLFTGDTLFVGDVGRPDLFSGNLNKEELASMMYFSLQKIKQLPEHIIIYPAHGPGSSCGKNLGPETHSTLLQEKEKNYAMQEMSEMEFIEKVTDGLQAPPNYFPINAKINKNGYDSLDRVMETALKKISVSDFKRLMQENNAFILDTRNATLFTQAFIPGSINIGLEGRFAEWAGALIPYKAHILLVTENGKEMETITRLARVGLDNIEGVLDGGFEAWQNANETLDLIIDIEADELKMDLNYDNNLLVLDVRTNSEYENKHIQDAYNLPLQEMHDVSVLSDLDEHNNIYIHCAGGYRSVIAASVLKKQGFHNIRNVLGGFNAISQIEHMPLVTEKKVAN